MAKFVKLFVALAALCILVLPAFSMPDYGMKGQDGNQKVCDCQKSMIGNDGKACDGQKPMMGMDAKALDGKKPCDGPKSMMGEPGNDGKAGCDKEIRSMMGGHGKDGFKAVIVSVKVIQ